MKSGSEKSSTTTSKPVNRAANQPFFAKAGGGRFFEPAADTNAVMRMRNLVNQPGDKDAPGRESLTMPMPASSRRERTAEPGPTVQGRQSSIPNEKDSEKRSDTFMKKELAEANSSGKSKTNIKKGEPVVLMPAREIEKTPAIKLTKKTTSDASGKKDAPPLPKRPALNEMKKAGKVNNQKITVPASKATHLAKAPVLQPVTSRKNYTGLMPERKLKTVELVETIGHNEHLNSKQKALGLLSQLKVKTILRKQRVSNETQRNKVELRKKIQTERTETSNIVQAGVLNAENTFHAKQTAVIAQGQQKKALLNAVLKAKLSGVDATTAAKTKNGQDQFSTRQKLYDDYIVAEKQQLHFLADAEASRGESELDTAASQARTEADRQAAQYQGSEDPRPKQRRAAQEVGQQSAEDITSKKQPLRQDLQDKALDYESKYDQFTESIHQQIRDAEQQAIPALGESTGEVKASIQQTFDATLLSIEQKVQATIQSLLTQKEGYIAAIRSGGAAVAKNIESLGYNSEQSINQVSLEITQDIDKSFTEAETYVNGVETPYLPGVKDVISAADAGSLNHDATCATSLEKIVGDAQMAAGNSVKAFTASSRQQTVQLTTSFNRTVASATGDLNKFFASFNTNADKIALDLSASQDGIISGTLAEVDKAINGAKEKISGFKNEFKAQIKEGANTALTEAKKPLTDPIGDRSNEAAVRAGESWWHGALRAVGDILIGFVILVVVALIVAAIAAAFGVILTAWTALMIAGAILLAIGLVFALIRRYRQARDSHGEHSYWIMLWALGDVTGVTMIIEGIFLQRDVVTGQSLSAGEATYRGITGVFTAVMLVLGARSAAKGPPGGTFTRPGAITFEFPGSWGEFFTGIREGWKGFGDLYTGIKESFAGLRRLFPAMWEGVKSVGKEFVTGLVKSARNLGKWIRERFSDGETKQRPSEEDVNYPSAKKEYTVGRENLRTTNRRFVKGEPGQLDQYMWDLVADTPDGPAIVSDQYVYTDGPNNPVSGPEQFLRPRTARLPDGTIVNIKSSGFKWTTESLRMGIEEFQRIFGFRPGSLSGELAMKNLSDFQEAFVRIRRGNPNGSTQDIANQAILETAFGKQRTAIGYGNISVKPTDLQTVTVAGVPENNVPTHVFIEARPRPTGGVIPRPPGRDEDSN